jgi:hypothetical protein
VSPSPALTAPPALDLAAVRATVETDGIAGLPGALDPDWVLRLRDDFGRAEAVARSVPGGTVGRGPNRHYFAVHPEQLSGFADLVTHPWITGLCEAMLGPGWQFVEVGFDVPLPGAQDQPWHRDFPMPPGETRLSSLAFNLTTITVTPEMGPLQIVPGSHREPGDDFAHGMFPPAARAADYTARAVPKQPRLGDASVRTGLALHRGTANRSAVSRPVLILGAVAPHVDTAGAHQLVLTRPYAAALPPDLRDRLRVTAVVDTLTPLVQRHDIEGLQMGG